MNLKKAFWKKTAIQIGLALCLGLGHAYAQDADLPATETANALQPVYTPNALVPSPSPESSTKAEGERNFYEVLDDVLMDFEFDLTNRNVTGLTDIAIRNVAVSENVPPSFKSHLELLITEKIMKVSKAKVFQCLACKARTTRLNGDQVTITSPETNPTELARIAKEGGIAHFMDVAFSYSPHGIVLSLYITEPESEHVIWTRGYNSELSRAAAFRRGVDYSQLDEARRQTEYTPSLQHRLTLYYLVEPNLPTTSGCLALGYRLVERYDNRKKEVGFEVNYMTDAATIINSAGASPKNIYTAFGFNLTLLFLHTWNFFGDEENYNRLRTGFTLGVGGTYASGFLGGLFRSSVDLRLGKHFLARRSFLATVHRPPHFSRELILELYQDLNTGWGSMRSFRPTQFSIALLSLSIATSAVDPLRPATAANRSVILLRTIAGKIRQNSASR